MNVLETIRKVSPLVDSLARYDREKFLADLIAGLIVAIMLVPQGMAYAMLAGLPPQVGLYASIVPLVLYSLVGTSNYLAVGPVAMVSLLVLSGVSELATPGGEEFIGLCLTLALLVGIIQIAMAIFRLGFLVNFISHPVLVGFTSAAAIVIGFSQVKHLIGTEVNSGEYPFQLIVNTYRSLGETNLATVAIGSAACIILVAVAFGSVAFLKRLGVKESIATTISKLGPLFVVVTMAIVVFVGQLNGDASVKIVGDIPSGLPGIVTPDLRWSAIHSLLPLALVITLVGYMESISVAKSLASRNRERVDANRELFALGLADLGAAVTAGYPVTGGFSRSMVNYSAGSRTPLSSVYTAVFVAVSVLFLTSLFYYIPKAVLGAIIVVAVAPLVDYKTPIKLWRYSRSDAIALMVTFVAVLAMGIESGILIGVGATVVMLVWKMSRPHVAEVGRVGSSEHFRNVQRHDVSLAEGILAIRVDESLNFANAPFVETYIAEVLASRPGIKNVLLIASGVNDIDATGLEALESIDRELKQADVGFYLSDVKGPIFDRLKRAHIDESFLEKQIFLSADIAIKTLQENQSATLKAVKSDQVDPAEHGGFQSA